MDESIEERVKDIVAVQFATPVEHLTAESTFSGLGGDSLDTVELTMALEDEFTIEISDDESAAINTVQQTVDLVTAKLSAKAAAAE